MVLRCNQFTNFPEMPQVNIVEVTWNGTEKISSKGLKNTP